MLLAGAAEFIQFQALFDDFFILFGIIINPPAFRAFQFNHVVLGHKISFIL